MLATQLRLCVNTTALFRGALLNLCHVIDAPKCFASRLKYLSFTMASVIKLAQPILW